MPDAPLLPCDVCSERATAIYLCRRRFGVERLRSVRCTAHHMVTCKDCRIVGITAVVAGG